MKKKANKGQVQPVVITPKHIKGAITEIRAGNVLFPKLDSDRAWNDANERAISILEKYKNGKGLFQL